MLRSVFFVLLGISAANAGPRSFDGSFNRLDSDKDELLSPAELLRVTRNLDGGFEATTAVIHAWYDADDSGAIDLGEWQDGQSGDPTPPDLTGAASIELDANRNGKVSRAEFWRVIPKFVPGPVTRQWFAAQFPGGQVSGPAGSGTGSTVWGGGVSGGTLTIGSSSSWSLDLGGLDSFVGTITLAEVNLPQGGTSTPDTQSTSSGGGVTGSVDSNADATVLKGVSGGLPAVGSFPDLSNGSLPFDGANGTSLGGSGQIGGTTTVSGGVLQPGSGGSPLTSGWAIVDTLLVTSGGGSTLYVDSTLGNSADSGLKLSDLFFETSFTFGATGTPMNGSSWISDTTAVTHFTVLDWGNSTLDTPETPPAAPPLP